MDGSEPWAARLDALRRRVVELEQRSRWSIEWALYRWAREHLPSAAIRIDGSEGLTGPAPARWRLLVHIDAETGAMAIAILEGRAQLTADNVVAAMSASSDAEIVIASRAGEREQWLPEGIDASATTWLRSGVDRLVDLALGRDAPPLGARLPHPVRLAAAILAP